MSRVRSARFPEPGHAFFEVGERPGEVGRVEGALVSKDSHGGADFGDVGEGERPDTMDVVPDPFEFVPVSGDEGGGGFDRPEGAVGEFSGLFEDEGRRFPMMEFSFDFPVDVFVKAFAGGGVTFPQFGELAVFPRIDELVESHSEGIGLTAAFGDPEAPEEAWGALSGVVDGVEDPLGGDWVAIHFGQAFNPVGAVGFLVGIGVPGVSGPGGVPHPVALVLDEGGAVSFVGRDGPVPV